MPRSVAMQHDAARFHDWRCHLRFDEQHLFAIGAKAVAQPLAKRGKPAVDVGCIDRSGNIIGQDKIDLVEVDVRHGRRTVIGRVR